MAKEGSSKIINFMTPQGRDYCDRAWPYMSYCENYSLKNLLYSQACIRQTKYIVMMTKERSTQIINFITPGAGVLAKWVWPYKYYSENTLFL